jgi:hypothetical protein
MGPRSGFVVSLLAAFGIHGALLLVPRAPIVEGAPIRTVVVELAAAPAPEPVLSAAVGPPVTDPASQGPPAGPAEGSAVAIRFQLSASARN